MPLGRVPPDGLHCPLCSGRLNTWIRASLHIDFCDGCAGLFLDRGELFDLFRAEGFRGPLEAVLRYTFQPAEGNRFGVPSARSRRSSRERSRAQTHGTASPAMVSSSSENCCWETQRLRACLYTSRASSCWTMTLRHNRLHRRGRVQSTPGGALLAEARSRFDSMATTAASLCGSRGWPRDSPCPAQCFAG